MSGLRFVAASLSGLLQYFAWLAPIPLLLAAFRASKREAWALAIVAGLIGGASTASYYGLFLGPIGSALVMLSRGLVSGRLRLDRRATFSSSLHPYLMRRCYTNIEARLDQGR